MDFEIHPQLEKDLHYMKTLELSRLYLLPDSDNPWVVLVPEVSHITEWHELSEEQQLKLCREIDLMSRMLKEKFSPDKINIGALGNMVPQLHIHIIARFKDDKAWPGSIWGTEWGQDEGRVLNYKKLITSFLDN